MIFTVIFEIKNGEKLEKKTATVRADSKKHAIRESCRDLGLDYPLSSNVVIKSVKEGLEEEKPVATA